MISLTDSIALGGLTTTLFMAGLLFVFSSAVMPGLRAAAPEEGLAAMVKINRDILNPIFGIAFAGSIVAAIAAIALSIGSLTDRQWLLVAGTLHLVGFAATTAIVHLPLNARLERLDPRDSADLTEWIDGSARWTRFNHVRSAATLLASIAYAMHLATQL